MTSVGVISSAVKRIKCLTELQKNPGSLPDEAEGLLEDLEEMKGLLAAAYRGGVEPGAKLEKEVVRISYDVVYTITGAFKPASIFDKFKKRDSSQLQEMQVQLKPYKEDLHDRVYPDQTAGLVRNPDSSAASPHAEKAGTELKPKEHHFGIPLRRINSGISSFVGRKVKNISDKVMMSKKPGSTSTGLDAQEESMTAGTDKKNPKSVPSSNVIKEDKTRLLGRLKLNLMSKDNPPEVYIMAKSGMGKKALASELYHDQEIRSSFDAFGWVSIKHNFQIKGVLQLLLQQLGRWQEDQQPQQQDLKEMSEIELISLIFDVVKDKSYLLVLDNIGSLQDWESIRLALPLTGSTRVIITTSSKDFSANPQCYKMLGLTQSEIVTLLNKEASFDSEVGVAIYCICGGSPLYATLLGKSLKPEANNKHLIKELRSYQSKKGTPHVLGACYKRLPLELKPCFLYLGQFPPCHDIPFDELYLLLAAENLIMPPPAASNSEISPQTLRDYLKTLADLKLVKVEEDLLSETGLYKSCRIHTQVREFCKLQGLEEEFIEIVDFKDSKKAVGPYAPRLAVDMAKYGGDATFRFKGHHTAKKVLSLLIFDAFDSAEEKSGWPSEVEDLSDFAHLRVLSFDAVDCRIRKLPRGLDKLLLLRFLSFRGCFLEELPSYLGVLKQLETLDLLVRDECNVIIPGNVFAGMKRMVHLFLPRRYQGGGKATTTKLSLAGMGMVETLVNFDTEVFPVEDLQQLKKLRTLSTISKGHSGKEMVAVVDLLNERKEKVQHSSMEITSFDCYNRASTTALEKLLHCGFIRSVKVEGQIAKLPAEGGGERIAEIVFQGSELELDPMEYFGKFQNLRSLTLANEAFMGGQIVIPPAPLFPKLRSLKLQNLQYLEKLTIEEGALPQLSSLQVENCGDALELTVPEELHQRLKNEIKGDAYSVVPKPSKFEFTTTP